MNHFLVALFWLSCALANDRHAISYFGDSRFGDRLLGYAQARYLSFVTDLPFLYKHFPYSDQLTIGFKASLYDTHYRKYRNTFSIYSAKTLSEFFTKIQDPNTPPTLFIVEYFPTDINEWEVDKSRSLCMNIPWHEEKFHAYLMQSLTPRSPIPNLVKEGCLNVADHVRTLSGGDTIDTSIAFLPLKHPNLDYHRRQIRRIYEWNLQKPMHVFLFSDTKQPIDLIEDFRSHFIGTNIEFNIQILERPDTDHVVQDFFAMQEFDALIATQSNFSMMAWRVGSLDLVIYPEHIIGQYPDSEIDRIHVISKKSLWFPFELDVIVKETDSLSSSRKWFPEIR